MVIHFQLVGKAKKNLGFFATPSANKDTRALDLYAGKIVPRDSPFKVHSAENLSPMDEASVILDRVTAKRRRAALERAKNGDFYGTQNVRMVTMHSLVVSALPNARTTCQILEYPALRNRRGGASENP